MLINPDMVILGAVGCLIMLAFFECPSAFPLTFPGLYTTSKQTIEEEYPSCEMDMEVFQAAENC